MAKCTYDFNFSENNFTQFTYLTNQIANLAAHYSINVTPYRDPKLVFFSNLVPSKQQTILNSLKTYLDIHDSTLNEGSSALDSSRVLWNALLKLGLRPTSDLFSYVESGNVIEIHDSNFTQIFRNINFFKYCGYTLEELYCFHMPELYTRDFKIENQLMDSLNLLYSGNIKTVLKMDLEPHIIYEKFSKELLQIQDKILYMAPLFSNNEHNSVPVATIAIEQALLHKDKNQFTAESEL